MDATTVWGGIYCYGATSVPAPDLNIANISGGKKLTIEIENKGDANATGVTGLLLITGGLFIHQGTYTFPEAIPAGATVTVDVPLFGVGLGFLKALPQVSVTINCTEGSSDSAGGHFKIFLSRITMVEG